MKIRNIFTLLLLTMALFVNAQSTNGLIYNFKFNGNLTDSINSNVSFVKTGTASTFVTDRNNNANSAFSVAGKTTASLTNLPVNQSARTVSVWFYFNSINNGEQHIFSYGTGATNQAFGFSVQPSAGTVRIYGWANDIQVTYNLTTGVWYNLIVTYDGVYATAYINGVQIINQVITDWNTSGQTFYLAESPGGVSSYNISYDDLRIYNRVLTYAEIAKLSNFSIDVNALKQSILSYYSFDTNFTNHNNGYPLSQNNTVSQTTGKKGNAVSFNGNNCLYNNNYSSLFDESTGAKPFTVSFWKKDAGTNSYSTMFELFSSYFARFRSTGKLEFGYQGANSSTWYYSISGANLLNSGSWTLCTVVHDPVNGIDMVYINGLYTVGFSNSKTLINKTNNVFSIGCGTNADGSFNASKNYMGSIDEFYIMNRVLTPAEISYMYNNVDFMTTTGLDNPKKTETLKIYPNPASDYITFEVSDNVKKEIWNLQGLKVAETTQNTLHIQGLSNGIYLVKYISDNETIGMSKFIKN